MNVEHIAIYVNDLDGARDFFIKYFEAQSNDLYHNVKTGFKSYFLTFKAGARLELMFQPDMVDHDKHIRRTGYAHIAMSTGSIENVDELTSVMANDGYEVLSGPRTTGDGYYESVVVSYENLLIEITV